MSAVARMPDGQVAEQRQAPADGAQRRHEAQGDPPRAPGTRRDTYRVLAALSIVGGVLHAKAMADHASHYWLFGVFFGVLSCWQTAWGVRAYRAQLSRRALVAGAWVSLAVVVIWLISRTVGLPIGPWAGEAEAVGIVDVMASLNELAIVAMVASLLSSGARPGLAWLRGGYAVRLGIALSTVSLFAATIGGHTHQP